MKNLIGTRIAEQRHLQNIGADSLYRIAHVLNVSMESLIEESISNNEELLQQRALNKA